MIKHNKEKFLGYWLVLPTFILFFIFFLVPVFYSFFLSFNKWNGFSNNMKFIWLQNYVRLFQDRMFWNAFSNNLIYALFTVPICIAISLLFSVLLNKKIVGYDALRVSYFVPYIVSLVAVGVVWSWIYSPGGFGLLNSLLGFFGVKPHDWLADPKLSMLSLIIIGVWKNIGYNIIIFIAGLKSISNTFYEAAKIDGATQSQQFVNITIPLLMPTIFFVTVTSTIYAFFQVFDVINVMTQGGPVGSTEVLVTYLYKMGFKQYEIGYASAISFVLFLIIVFITVIQKKLLENKVEY